MTIVKMLMISAALTAATSALAQTGGAINSDKAAKGPATTDAMASDHMSGDHMMSGKKMTKAQMKKHDVMMMKHDSMAKKDGMKSGTMGTDKMAAPR